MRLEMRMRVRVRLILTFELLFGLIPLTYVYLYLFPVGVFWIGQVLELASEGIGNAYTAGIAFAFVAGAIGLLGVWIALVARLIGRAPSSRLMLAGVSVGVVIGGALMLFLAFTGSWWTDYYLVGSALVVAIHQLYLCTRSSRLENAVT